MTIFENVLSLLIKNSYANINLSQRFNTRFKKMIINTLLSMPFIILVATFISYPYSVKEFSDNNILTINYIHTFLWVFILIILFIYFIINFFDIKYKSVKLHLYGTTMMLIMFLIIISMPLSGLFMIDNIQITTVYSYYLSYLLLIVFYISYYHKKWKTFLLNKYLVKIKKKLELNSYSIDLEESFFKFDLKEDEKNKPKLTKIAESIVGFMMRFGFTIPVLAALSSSGTGGDAMFYLAIYMMLFIIPLFMKMVSGQTALYSILKQIEKEEGITIYNGTINENISK